MWATSKARSVIDRPQARASARDKLERQLRENSLRWLREQAKAFAAARTTHTPDPIAAEVT